MTPPRPAKGDSRRDGALTRVTRDARPFLRARTGTVLRLAGWSLLEFVQTFLGGYGVARALDHGFLAGRPLTGLLWLAVAAVAVLPAQLATRGVFGRLADLVEPLRDGLVRRAVSRALAGALAHPAGTTARSLSQVTHQSEIARDGWAGLVLTLRSFVFTVAGAVAGLLALEPRLLLIVLPPLILGAALFLATLLPMAARQRDYLTADEAYAAHAGKAAADLRDIAAAGAADRTVAESRALADDQVRAARSLARWSGVRVVALAVCGRFPPLLLLLGAPWLLRDGLTPGALVGALTYLTQALAPAVQALMTMLSTVGGRLLVVLDRFTDAPPPPAADDRPPSVPPVRGSAPVAELRAVTFAYGPAAHPVLDRLSLTVAPGEHLAVVGPSGSGKSTLAAVIAGVERPTAGAVRWHGRPVRPADATAVRVLLPQHAYVFTGSLRDNFCYLRPAAGDRDLAAMIDALGLDPLLSRLGSLDAPLEPDRLSQGERQLIALGRAYVAAPPLIVLDEATSRLDPAAETRAELAFAALPGALVVVAHRLSSARRADRILVMDGPRTCCGTSAELLRTSALYRDLAGLWEPDEEPRENGEPDGRPRENGLKSSPPPSLF
ncbi:ATP-binding cassette domain-containing protein [Streptomyces microflavus]|uniref:ABC transporter ATP-binding protein n=1 Tax=Streptomyces microflavus TaxID=1919 RepID=A0A7J0CWJ4_STRMI|nr:MULTISPECIES: ATP-binding cassette domain-containing protein [Streptomyces]MDX2975418.1 ATP-binding cassette domain-containing protein [Streptomyces sp. NRRL_B-2249]GFN06906.1 ABC transporter ATP-binding protein [Streptomyces microflavus]GGX80104.1 ABC transporter ATP-binding protein [Streptomyces microflavus]